MMLMLTMMMPHLASFQPVEGFGRSGEAGDNALKNHPSALIIINFNNHPSSLIIINYNNQQSNSWYVVLLSLTNVISRIIPPPHIIKNLTVVLNNLISRLKSKYHLNYVLDHATRDRQHWSLMIFVSNSFFYLFKKFREWTCSFERALKSLPLYKWQGNIIIQQHEMGFLTFSKEDFTFENMKVA